MTFQAPLWLLALPAVVALVVFYVLLQLRRKAYAARFTNVALLGSIVPKRPGWRRHLAFGVVALGLTTLVVSLAVPSTEVRVPRERATVVMAVDVSLSMQATDIEPDRFRAMQTAAKEFVDVLPERINLGLVSFAGTATTVVPPTTDRVQVAGAIDNLDLAEATAIGEAVFTSLTAIENFQSSLDAGAEEEAAPARIVLLSDGYNTVGREDTQAIDAARAAGVPVSTIAFGTDYGTLDLDGETVPVPVDRATLEEIADQTGGSYSEAASASELEQVYADLGSQIGYTTEPQDISPWFVRAGVLLALLGAVLSLLWTNRLV
jgi:Ca-activated chloride channel family protein